jgi:hypothetical protein
MKTEKRERLGRSWEGRLLGALALGALLAGCGAEEAEDGDDTAIMTELKDGLGEQFGDRDPMGGAGMCTIEIEGGTCRSDAAWQRIAAETCRERGQTLAGYRPFRSCGPGQFRRVAYACCPAAPPPPPPPGMCFDSTLGAGVCRDAATLKAEAQKVCDSRNLLLAKFTPARECGMGSYQTATFTCCDKGPPPPPPPACFDGTLGGGACLDEATLKAQAEMTCRGKGFDLTVFKAERSCGMGKFQVANYTCCEPKVPPPPMCFESVVDGGGACRDLMGLQADAERVCAAKMFRLDKFVGEGDCGMGRYQKARFACCPP